MIPNSEDRPQYELNDSKKSYRREATGMVPVTVLGKGAG